MHLRNPLAALVLTGLAVSAALAQDATTLNTRSLAATCASCHGTDGRPVAGSALAPLAGMPREVMLAQFKAFKDGSRPATVMHQLAKGYSDQQVEALATYFSTLKR
jgi:cytochrome subunit of sulfide dehydrogenase